MKIKRIESEFLDSNVFVLTEGQECLIVDAGVKTSKVKQVVKDKKVIGVLLTHGHYDHVYYAEEYKEKFDCPIYISKQGKFTAINKDLTYGDNFAIKKTSIFNVFNVEKTFKCGNFKIKIYKTPGHCPGSVCYQIGNDFFAGDTLFKTGIGRCDLLNSDENSMLESLKKLKNVKFDVCHSGHGEDSTWEEQQRNIIVHIKFLQRKQ